MIRIVEILLSDIVINPADASRRLGTAVSRQGGMTVVGMGCVEERVQLYLEPLEEFDIDYAYRFAPFEGYSSVEISAEVSARYNAGFSTIGTFEIGEQRWGLFRKIMAADMI